jgi:hypothetical protein
LAVIGPGNCVDVAFANIAAPKDSAESNAIGRCRCILCHPTTNPHEKLSRRNPECNEAA